MKLTKMEIKFLNAMRENEFEDLMEEGTATWLFSVQDDLDYTKAQTSGIMSSLTKKGVIDSSYSQGEHLVWFTKKAEELFMTATGKKCSWGGYNLLAEEEEA